MLSGESVENIREGLLLSSRKSLRKVDYHLEVNIKRRGLEFSSSMCRHLARTEEE
jgi:hypothetical protein